MEEENENIIGLADISDEILLNIFSHVDSTDLYQLSRTCKRLKYLVNDVYLWQWCDARAEPNNRPKYDFCETNFNAKTYGILFAGRKKTDILCVGKFLKNLSSYENLTVLAMENQTILSNVTLRDFPPTLEELSLRNTFVANFKLFFKAASLKLPNLKVLCLDRCNWFDSHSILSMSKFTQLRILSLYMCKRLSDKDSCYISLAGRWGFAKLEVLDVRFTNYGDELIKSFYRRGTLTEIYFQAYVPTYPVENIERQINLLTEKQDHKIVYNEIEVDDTDRREMMLQFGEDYNLDKVINSVLGDSSLMLYREMVKVDMSDYTPTKSVLYTRPYGPCTCKRKKFKSVVKSVQEYQRLQEKLEQVKAREEHKYFYFVASDVRTRMVELQKLFCFTDAVKSDYELMVIERMDPNIPDHIFRDMETQGMLDNLNIIEVHLGTNNVRRVSVPNGVQANGAALPPAPPPAEDTCSRRVIVISGLGRNENGEEDAPREVCARVLSRLPPAAARPESPDSGPVRIIREDPPPLVMSEMAAMPPGIEQLFRNETVRPIPGGSVQALYAQPNDGSPFGQWLVTMLNRRREDARRAGGAEEDADRRRRAGGAEEGANPRRPGGAAEEDAHPRRIPEGVNPRRPGGADVDENSNRQRSGGLEADLQRYGGAETDGINRQRSGGSEADLLRSGGAGAEECVNPQRSGGFEADRLRSGGVGTEEGINREKYGGADVEDSVDPQRSGGFEADRLRSGAVETEESINRERSGGAYVEDSVNPQRSGGFEADRLRSGAVETDEGINRERSGDPGLEDSVNPQRSGGFEADRLRSGAVETDEGINRERSGDPGVEDSVNPQRSEGFQADRLRSGAVETEEGVNRERSGGADVEYSVNPQRFGDFEVDQRRSGVAEVQEGINRQRSVGAYADDSVNQQRSGGSEADRQRSGGSQVEEDINRQRSESAYLEDLQRCRRSEAVRQRSGGAEAGAYRPRYGGFEVNRQRSGGFEVDRQISGGAKTEEGVYLPRSGSYGADEAAYRQRLGGSEADQERSGGAKTEEGIYRQRSDASIDKDQGVYQQRSGGAQVQQSAYRNWYGGYAAHRQRSRGAETEQDINLQRFGDAYVEDSVNRQRSGGSPDRRCGCSEAKERGYWERYGGVGMDEDVNQEKSGGSEADGQRSGGTEPYEGAYRQRSGGVGVDEGVNRLRSGGSEADGQRSGAAGAEEGINLQRSGGAYMEDSVNRQRSGGSEMEQGVYRQRSGSSGADTQRLGGAEPEQGVNRGYGAEEGAYRQRSDADEGASRRRPGGVVRQEPYSKRACRIRVQLAAPPRMRGEDPIMREPPILSPDSNGASTSKRKQDEGAEPAKRARLAEVRVPPIVRQDEEAWRPRIYMRRNPAQAPPNVHAFQFVRQMHPQHVVVAENKSRLLHLSLRGYEGVTDLTLRCLRHLRLDLLDVTGTKVTEDGLRQFLLANPKCRVLHETACTCRPRLHF